jgi:hypothetical protein
LLIKKTNKQESTKHVGTELKEKCLQRLIRDEWLLTVFSLLTVLVWLFYWYFVIHAQIDFPNDFEYSNFEDLVSMGMQRQLFWAVVALSSFIGFFEFLGAVTRHKNFSWLHKLVSIGFAFATTFSVTRIADSYKWVAILEERGGIPIESPSVHGFIFSWLPVLVFPFCLFMWFLFLCFLIEKTVQTTAAV